MLTALALVAAAISAEAADRRSLQQAVDAAVDYCAAGAFGNTARLDGRIIPYEYAPNPAMARTMRSFGSQLTDDAPDVIRRFTATAGNSRAVGHRDIIAIEAGDGVVWLVKTADPALCDMAITNIDDPASISAAVVAGVTGNAGWSVEASQLNGPIQTASFLLEVNSQGRDGAKARITATVVPSVAGTPTGIQAELSFAARPRVPASQTNR